MQLPRPSKIVCVGLNYVDHANEVALELPERPLLFAKWPNALIGDGDEIVIPKGINNVDYEAELAVIIGRQTRSVGAAEALDSIAAYTCLNDVSARDNSLPTDNGRVESRSTPSVRSAPASCRPATSKSRVHFESGAASTARQCKTRRSAT